MRDLPLERYELFRSTELDFTRETVGKIFTPHRLELIGQHARLDAWLRTRRVRNLTINYISYGGDVCIEPGQLDTFFVVQVPVAGKAEVHCGTQRVCSTPELGSVVSPVDRLSMLWSADCTQLVCRIERPALEAHLSDILGAPLHRPLRFEAAMDLTTGGGMCWKLGLTALAKELDRPNGILDNPLAAHHVEQGLMTALLLSQPNNYTSKISGERATAPTRAVDVALELIESHPEREFTTPELAREVGVSMRALQRGFQKYLNTSPMAYLKNTRLRRVRDALRAAEPDAATVADIAAQWGFTHPGHFASGYRQLFGEKPSETLRR